MRIAQFVVLATAALLARAGLKEVAAPDEIGLIYPLSGALVASEHSRAFLARIDTISRSLNTKLDWFLQDLPYSWAPQMPATIKENTPGRSTIP